MKNLKKLFSALTVFSCMIGSNVQAQGIPVIDASGLAQSILQVEAWGKQYTQMRQQFNQMKSQYDSLNGIRDMGSLVNNPALRQYLPAEYRTILNSGYGNWEVIRNGAKIWAIENTKIGSSTDTGKAFEAKSKQAAINRAVAEDGYKEASRRFDDIQVLLDKINVSPDAKDISDLQARIQAEQVMMQNESIKLNMLAQLADAQRGLEAQAATERQLKSISKPIPRW